MERGIDGINLSVIKRAVDALRLAACMAAVLLLLVMCACRGSREMEIYYFYNNICELCDERGKFYDVFNGSVGDIKDQYNYSITIYNIFYSGSSEKLQSLKAKYHIDIGYGFPVLIVNGKALQGDSAIRDGLRGIFIREGARYRREGGTSAVSE